MAQIMLVTHGSKGDVLPFVRLGRALASRGHEVTLLTHSVFGDAARGAGIGFMPIDTEEEYQRRAQDELAFMLGELGGFDRDSVRAFYQRIRVFEQVAVEVRALARLRDDPDAIVVGRHTSGLSSLIAKELYGLPVVWVAVTPAQHMSMPATVAMQRDFLADQVNAMRADFALPPVSDWSTWYDLPDRQVGLWPLWFDRAGEPAPRGLEPVGFMLDDGAESGELPAGLAGLLDSQPAPVLVTGTTGGFARDAFKPAALAAAARLGRTAIVVGGRPDDLPSDAAWYSSLPFRDVMPRVAAVIHHGGIGTMARALGSGTPQLILAYHFDRPDNGRRLQSRSLARWLPPKLWTADAITDALGAVLAAGPTPERFRPDYAAAADAACARIEDLLPVAGAGSPRGTRRAGRAPAVV